MAPVRLLAAGAFVTMLAGVPNPARAHGRAALGRLRRRDVRIVGDRALGRKLLQLLEL